MRSLVMAAALLLFGASAQADGRPVLVELFTSQGCSSCPAADSFMEELVRTDGVVALTYPVDIWDYLGWKDTLASHDNTVRQRGYADARGDRQVYTPQMVVNGTTHVVGGNREEIAAALAETAPLPVEITMEPGTDSTMVTVGAVDGPGKQKGTIWLAMYDDPVTVPIEQGENDGKSVTYYNVVRKLRPIAMWKGKEVTIELPKSELDQAEVSRCAVILQTEREDGLPGPILGAATINYTH